MTERARGSIAAPPPLRAQARAALERARDRAVESGALPEAARGAAAPAVEIEHPADPLHGDLASNLAMKLARPCRMAPLAIASALKEELDREIERDASATPIAAVDVAPPGFINLRLADRALEGLVDAVLASPETWGTVEPVRPRRVNVEFVSANPTGPLTIGNARGAFIGDLLSRVLEAGGQEVTREYYFNDAGASSTTWALPCSPSAAARRSRRMATTALCRALAAAVPDDVWADLTADETTQPSQSAAGQALVSAKASRPALNDLACTSTSGRPRRRSTRAAGSNAGSSGSASAATCSSWTAHSGSASTDFGDDKDRVIIRSNGSPTYFAADIGYVTEKFSRGFDHLIYVWGADHHGTIARVRGAAEAMGYDPERVQILLTRGSASSVAAPSLHVQALRRVHHARRAARARSASMPRAGSSHRGAIRARSTSTSSSPRSSPTRTRSTTCSTRTRESPRSCARRRRPACHPPRRWPARWPAAPRAR